jgi:hypothetical protein
MEKEPILPPEEVNLPAGSLWSKVPPIAGVVGVVALVVAFLVTDRHQLAFSYLAGYVYWLTLALGGLFFVLVHYLARAGWSVVVRRLAEQVAGTLPLFAVLFVPIALFLHELYHWTHPEGDPLLEHKEPWLNPGFFLVRAVFYLAVWVVLAHFFRRWSVGQDQDGDPATTRRMQTLSAPGMVLFAITLNFAAFDWVMSLEPHWFSTIFGVYLFGGSVVAIFATLILLTVMLQRGGQLRTVVTEEHYHDMGKMLFAFVVFWAYIGFSQFMLIWYANIPEETHWFAMRWHGGWEHVSIFLAAGHFGLPFFFLLPQPIKRRRTTITLAAVWLLLMHWVDVYWLVLPTAHDVFHPTLADFLCWLGIGGLFVAVLGRLMVRRPLVPVRDPRLVESLAFESV